MATTWMEGPVGDAVPPKYTLRSYGMATASSITTLVSVSPSWVCVRMLGICTLPNSPSGSVRPARLPAWPRK